MWCSPCCDRDGGQPVTSMEPNAGSPPVLSYQHAEMPNPMDLDATYLEALAARKVGSLNIEFDTGDGTRIVEVTEAPIGIDLTNNVTPLTVLGVQRGGAGEKAGVQAGWVIKRVGSTSLEGLDYLEGVEVVKRGVERLHYAPGQEVFPPGALVIEFFTGHSTLQEDTFPPDAIGVTTTRKIGFTKRPLGMTLDTRSPSIKGITAGGHAARLGVQVGWTITVIGKVDVERKDFLTVLKMLQAGSYGLPSDPAFDTEHANVGSHGGRSGRMAEVTKEPSECDKEEEDWSQDWKKEYKDSKQKSCTFSTHLNVREYKA